MVFRISLRSGLGRFYLLRAALVLPPRFWQIFSYYSLQWIYPTATSLWIFFLLSGAFSVFFLLPNGVLVHLLYGILFSVDLDRMKSQSEVTFTGAYGEVLLKVRVGLVNRIMTLVYFFPWVRVRTGRWLTFCHGTNFSVRALKEGKYF